MSFKLRLSVLSIAIFQTFSVQAAIPANPSIETITVTGDRFDASPEQQLAVINTIEREEISRLNPKSVVDLLETLPGVSVTRNGGAGQSASISMRGTNSSHVLVLIDGVRIGSATLGAVSFNALSPENIERIEVVKGPRAAVWGSDAIGGVIQIFTRKLEGGEWFASAEYGSDEYMRATAGLGVSHGDGHTSLSINREQSDGYDIKNDAEDDDDGYDRLGISINGQQNLNQEWTLTWIGQLDTGHYEYDNSRANEADYDNYLWNVAAQYQTDTLTSKLAVGQSQDKNENFRADNSDLGVSLYKTTRDQVNWSNRYSASDNLTFIGGVDWSKESIAGDYAIDERDLVGIYGLARYQYGKLLMEGIVRYDDVENIDSETSYNASLAYQLNEQWRITASAGTGFQAPSFNDLYWPGTGNPDLVSETSENLDLTVHYSSDNLRGYVSLYQNTINNLIQWAPTPELDEDGYEIWKPANIQNAEITGVELSLNYSTWGVEHQLGYSYIDAIDQDGDEQLVGRSEHEFDYAMSYTWSALDILMNYHFQGERNAGDIDYDGTTDYLDAYHQLDLSLGYKLGDAWLLRLKANNLLDEEIISDRNYFSPGRQLFLSVSYQAF
ncbi:TonB-dependent receptor [Shewanella schlegeliana]|uniref:TonB-dependent receptor n=1 Tax=Shewanella schlegeliana TaxID=190308 RepID=A0ABS1T1I1_9GAMM|nr:TonB-dependent receptor [Shewanella schlegeliana]MBL4914014.1 TonB-dependent receptor [Shewanella schlegeliana]MCL1108602.1 TonB-dependent receptor [Shewanella schlegeliana]GIU35663.1 TonB-dependent receptor [Shewanella schlegeliana]